jgi:hypothetical protein
MDVDHSFGYHISHLVISQMDAIELFVKDFGNHDERLLIGLLRRKGFFVRSFLISICLLLIFHKFE